MPDVLPVDAVLQDVGRRLADRRPLPESTYRLQFHAGFTFRDATRLVPYLHELGVTHCYASPYLKARPGSRHGYDIQDHSALNPEIGSPDEYEAWVEALHAQGMGQILDVVPNHMGIVGNGNPWWNDVLENGPSSPFADYFDIDWVSYKPTLHQKVLLPVLGGPYGKVLEAGQLRLGYEGGAFAVHYFEHRFPISPDSYGKILGLRLPELEATLGAGSTELTEYQSILTAIAHLPPRSATAPDKVAERQREKEVIKRRLHTLTQASAPVREFVEANVALVDGATSDPGNFDRLDDLLNAQAYRLCYWRVAADEINYRRFFDINELAALSMEKPEVFQAAHALLFRLLREGKVDGLRIDHPDGLFNPKQYLERLQEHFLLETARAVIQTTPEYREVNWAELEAPLTEAIRAFRQAGPESPWWRPLYVVVEKILMRDEPLPADWPVDGTTGYEFLNVVNGLLVDAAHVAPMTRVYERWTHDRTPFRDVLYQKKFLILQVALSGELHMLAYQLDRLAQAHRWSRDFTLNGLRHALRDVIACFPVYRSYITDEGIPPRDPLYVLTAVQRAKRKNPALSASVFDYIYNLLLLRGRETADERERQAVLRFVGKFQQVTSPVMAKGFEDTSFYTYNRLLSLNEVGGNPEQFGTPPAVVHKVLRERQRLWPRALSATATHDTKRGEDVRARLDVLSEWPGPWRAALHRWSKANRRHRIVPDDEDMVIPDRKVEYLFYQTLVGAWPVEPYDADTYREFVTRIQAYMHKAVHEAKEYTSWMNPDARYDDAIHQFVGRVLDEHANHRFLADFRAFQRRVSHYGFFNSLTQTLLKITAPGVPDVYQGTELWDFSLVDPDNRRPVDYERRQELLRSLGLGSEAGADHLRQLARDLVQHLPDGRIKLFVTALGLRCRRDHPNLLTAGEYVPLETRGHRAANVFAFLRRLEGACALVAVPRLLTQLVEPEGLPLGREAWQDTVVLVPAENAVAPFRNVFTAERFTAQDESGQRVLSAADLFADFPVALLLAHGSHP